jgi:hypothetical protein
LVITKVQKYFLQVTILSYSFIFKLNLAGRKGFNDSRAFLLNKLKFDKKNTFAVLSVHDARNDFCSSY